MGARQVDMDEKLALSDAVRVLYSIVAGAPVATSMVIPMPHSRAGAQNRHLGGTIHYTTTLDGHSVFI